MHSWIGVSASIMFGFTYIVGAGMAGLTQLYPDSPIHKAVDLRFYHRLEKDNVIYTCICLISLLQFVLFRFLGVTSSVLIACAIASGVMDQLGQGSCYYLITDSISASIYKNPVNYYNDIPGACKVAHGAVILVLISTACIGIAVALRPPSKKPTFNVLSHEDEVNIGVDLTREKGVSSNKSSAERGLTPRVVYTHHI